MRQEYIATRSFTLAATITGDVHVSEGASLWWDGESVEFNGKVFYISEFTGAIEIGWATLLTEEYEIGMGSTAINRMKKHVSETIHRDILVMPNVGRPGILLLCRTCAYQTILPVRALMQSPQLRDMLSSQEMRMAFAREFRYIPPQDNSAWAKILDPAV